MNKFMLVYRMLSKVKLEVLEYQSKISDLRDCDVINE